tara:strand:- start:490 stop:603 length:114 start_codon:yes stop_codon:yes gene_type:complete
MKEKLEQLREMEKIIFYLEGQLEQLEEELTKGNKIHD